MAWSKGQSGNPKGRPPKKRALSELLEKTGKRKIELPGLGKVAPNQLLATRIWTGLISGSITFPDGHTIMLDASQYLALARMVYNQVDGPPKAEVDVTTDNKPIQITIAGVPSREKPPTLDE